MTTRKWQQWLWQWRGVLVIAPSVAAAVVLIRSIGLLQAWEWAAFDQYMRLRPVEDRDSRVVIVGINESDLTKLNQAVVSDQVIAQVLTNIKEESPRAIGLDLYRDLSVSPGRYALRTVFNTTPNLVGIRKVVGEVRQETVPGPPDLVALGQVGANDLIADADSTVRRAPIWLQDSNTDSAYGFGFYLALLYLEAEDISPVEIEQDVWWLGKTLFRPFESDSGGYISADAGGYQQIINYRNAAAPFEIVSLTDVLEKKLPEGWATEKVVLLGTVSESGSDFFHTPHSGALLSQPNVISGVEVHAHFTSQIISAAMDARPIFKSWPESVEWLWILLWSSAGALLVRQFDHTHHTQRKLWQKSGLIVSAGFVLVATTYLPFLAGWWLPVVPACLSAVGAAAVTTAYIARSASDIRRTFGRYLSDEIVTTLLEYPEGQSLGGDRRKITILTSDLRGFTTISERLSPEVVIKVLNFYLGCMADVITRYNGTIDEFMGDGILVLFGAPICRDHDAQRAVACAVEMQLAMTKVNEAMKAWELPPLEMGIGIHTGEVVVGNIGSEKRTKYGVVGAPVNLTYRIESFTTGGQILISQETLTAAAPVPQVQGQRAVQSKGVARPITVFDVGGVGAPYNLALCSKKENFVKLGVPIRANLNVLDGKHIGNETLQGHLIELSEKGALLWLRDMDDITLTPLANLKLNLVLDAARKKSDPYIYSEDTYAKVVEQTHRIGVFHIHFTARPPTVAARLDKIYGVSFRNAEAKVQ